MTAITIADLNNAKTDVDHIADIATSVELTATDRLGHVKSTLAAAIDSIKSFTDRGAWAALTVYAGKDLVSNAGTWYVCVVPHTSSAAFATDTASKWRVYQGITVPELAASSGASLVGYLPAGTGAVATTVQSKLRESVSVKDFGAVGDGVTDDTAAIQAALLVADVIYIPAGTYRISQIVITGSGNTAIFGKTIRGAGLGVTNLVGTVAGNSMIRLGTTGGWVDETNLQEYRADYCSLENLSLSATAAYVYGIECVWLTNSSFKNITVSSGGFISAGMYVDFSWDNNFTGLTLAAPIGLDFGGNGPNANLFNKLRCAGGGTGTIGVNTGGNSNAFISLDSSGYAVGVGSSDGGYGCSIVNGYFESNGVDIEFGGAGFYGVSITGCTFLAGTGVNTGIQQLGAGNVWGVEIAGNCFRNKTTGVIVTDKTIGWSIHGNTNLSVTTPIAYTGVGGSGHDIPDFEFSFTPVWTGLTVVGAAPTYVGKYIMRGNSIKYRVSIVTAGADTTASVAGTTYFTGLPSTSTTGYGHCVATDGGLTSLGVGLNSTTFCYVPSWTARISDINISGEYVIAD